MTKPHLDTGLVFNQFWKGIISILPEMELESSLFERGFSLINILEQYYSSRG
jgi:hypothetical protein